MIAIKRLSPNVATNAANDHLIYVPEFRSALGLCIVSGTMVALTWVMMRPADILGAVMIGASTTASAALGLACAQQSMIPPAPGADSIARSSAGVVGEAETTDASATGEARATGDARVVDDAWRQAEKLETMGRCLGEFAHDFNNLLHVILCNLDRASRLAAPGTKASACLADATLAGERAARLVVDILAFLRRQPSVPELIDVDRLLGAMRPLIAALADGFALDFELGCGWLCHVEANQLENAVLNLIVNARDAMPDGGRVTIATVGVTIGADDLRHGAGEYVQLTVCDTGKGMTPEVARRAFEPFFTTKPVGRGTGLGLSQIAGFARSAGGAAWIDSAPDLGTRVSLLLPRAAPASG